MQSTPLNNSKEEKLVKSNSSPFHSLKKWLEGDSELIWNEARQEIKAQAIRKLEMLDEMHQELVERAHSVLDKARDDLRLHGIPVNASKIRGKKYYLYKKDSDGNTFFSILNPSEYASADPSVIFLAAYFLNEDNTWTKIEKNSDFP
jgi:hypothetical protein